MNPDGDNFTPQTSNAPPATKTTQQQNMGAQQPLSQPMQTQPVPNQPMQPQPIPQQISQFNTQPIPVQNQAPQQQVPAVANTTQLDRKSVV